MSDEIATGNLDRRGLRNVAVAAIYDFEDKGSLNERSLKGEGGDSKISGVWRNGIGIDFPAWPPVRSENFDVESERVIIKAWPILNAGEVLWCRDSESGIW